MKRAAIDIGTNAVLLTIAHVRSGSVEPVLDRSRVTRLGAHVDRTQRLDPEAMRRTVACLSDYQKLIQEHGATDVRVGGTSALRDADNGHVFLEQVEASFGWRVRVLDGGSEARLTFRGALSDGSTALPDGSLSGGQETDGLSSPLRQEIVVFDIGGGSTEIIQGTSDGAIRRACSLDIGSVRLTERLSWKGPVRPEQALQAREWIQRSLAPVLPTASRALLVGVAGTVTTLAALVLNQRTRSVIAEKRTTHNVSSRRGTFEGSSAPSAPSGARNPRSPIVRGHLAERVHGAVLERSAVDAVTERLLALTPEERTTLGPIEPGRADVIAMGAIICQQIMAAGAWNQLQASERGVRYGLLLE